MAAVIIRRVVVSKANRNKVVKATEMMSATAGKTHSAHLHKLQNVVGCMLAVANGVSAVGASGTIETGRMLKSTRSLLMQTL